jgi:hypothetical protein
MAPELETISQMGLASEKCKEDKMTRRIFVRVLASLLCLCVYAQQRDLLDLDGNDWNSYPEIEKLGFTQGFALAVNLGWALFPSDQLLIKEDALKNTREEYMGIMLNRKDFMDKLYGITLFDITMGQFIAGLDTFYKDFSNYRIKVVDAIFVIKMQIQGKNPRLIEAQVRYLKMQPIAGETRVKALEKMTSMSEENKKKTGRYGVTQEDIKNNRISSEEILSAGFFIDENNNHYELFSYGKYD